jgi:hypothetical protein
MNNKDNENVVYREIAGEELNKRYTKKELIEKYLALAAKADAMEIKLEKIRLSLYETIESCY